MATLRCRRRIDSPNKKTPCCSVTGSYRHVVASERLLGTLGELLTGSELTLPGQSKARPHVKVAKTDSEEEIIFVFEKPARLSNAIIINQDKLLALQRDVDQESQPKEPARPWVTRGMVTLDVAAGDLKEVDECRGRGEGKHKRRRKDEDAGSLKMKAKKDKKKKKGETNEEGPPDDEKPPPTMMTTRKKKKKKTKQLQENGDVSQQSLAQEEPSGKKQKKLKKTNDQSVQSKAAGCFKNEEEEGTASKKKKKRPAQVMVESQSEMINVDGDDVMKTPTAKKNRAGREISATKAVAVKEESQGVHQKAKKRKAHLETAEDTLETVEKKKKKKKKNKNDKGKQEEAKPTKRKKASSSDVVVKEESPKPKKKKTKGLKSDVPPKVEGDQEVSVVDLKEQKRKKKKKKAKEDELVAVKDTGQNTETLVFVASGLKGKRKKQAKKGASEEITIEAKKEEVEVTVDEKKKKTPRKKIKLEQDACEVEPAPEESPQTDVVFLSEKTGNRDEVTINQERRQALQMVIDKESQSQSPAKPSGFGQWGTAQFGSTEKRQKFLRLMGGFKKETDTGGPAPPSAQRPNMALTQGQQQNLHQALLGEFERAQSRRADFSSRGVGLGFSAAPSKKFSIDANASRSIRFDD